MEENDVFNIILHKSWFLNMKTNIYESQRLGYKLIYGNDSMHTNVLFVCNGVAKTQKM